MTKYNQDFVMHAGNDIDISASISGSDAGAYDMSSASVDWIMELEPQSGSLMRKTIDDDISISTSIITISISASDTTEFSGTYYHEARSRDILGRYTTLLVGNVTINNSSFT